MSKFFLILGGNGFIGAEVVEHLLNHFNDPKIVLLNRGHWSWDSKSRIKDRVFASIQWDRKEDSIKSCLNQFLKDPFFVFEAVVDFSAYKKKDVQRVLRELPAYRFRVYILISTDSVYEVSVPNKNSREYSIEIDAVRPSLESECEKLKKMDSYAHHKFGCEEALLEKANDSNELKFVIFRLADVIGARDSTERFWFYQMYLQYLAFLESTIGNFHEIRIPELYFDRKTSFTYVKDVAKAILVVLQSEVRNEIFNIGCEQALSLKDFNDLLASKIKPGLENQLKYVADDKSDYDLFPSVNRGPINIQKLKSMLEFEQTDIKIALEETIRFYDISYSEFPEERKSIERSLKKMFFAFDQRKMVQFETFIQKKTQQAHHLKTKNSIY